MEQNDIAIEEAKHMGVDNAAIIQPPEPEGVFDKSKHADDDEAAIKQSPEPVSQPEEVK